MEPEELRKIVESVIEEKVFFQWWHYVILLLFTAASAFFGSFLRQKGKNLATQKDISEITKKIEEVRSYYTSQQQLRMASLDKRLAVHQEAYSLWYELTSANIFDKRELETVLDKCIPWWEKNCLYLEPEAREAFINSCTAAFLHWDLFNQRAKSEDLQENWKVVNKAGEIIVNSVALPCIVDKDTGIEYRTKEKKGGVGE